VAVWSLRRTASASCRTAATASGEGALAMNVSPSSPAGARTMSRPGPSPTVPGRGARRASIRTPKGSSSWERTRA
jgi:hypothetical protein